MGCDIHAFVENRHTIGRGQWLQVASFSLDRDYEIFGALAGVRGEGAPVVKPRGLPPDVSFTVRHDYARAHEDWHTPSWLEAEEYSNALGHWRSRNDAEIPVEYAAVLAYMRQLNVHGESRLVFWFDN